MWLGNSAAKARVEWLADEERLQGAQSLHPLFALLGQTASDATEGSAAAGRAETAGDLLLDFEHLQITYRAEMKVTCTPGYSNKSALSSPDLQSSQDRYVDFAAHCAYPD